MNGQHGGVGGRQRRIHVEGGEVGVEGLGSWVGGAAEEFGLDVV